MTATLLLLNGPPGIGKTTLARRYVADRPLACCLDVDTIRAMLGRWDSHERESGLLARAIALAAARVHLAAGHDVVVPQLVAGAPFAAELAEAAAEAGATFAEVVLMDTRENALRRFAARGADADADADAHHRDAERLSGGAAGLGAMYDRLLAAVATRPVTVVDTRYGDPDAAYAALLAALASARPSPSNLAK